MRFSVPRFWAFLLSFWLFFSFFSCLSVGLGDGFQGDCNRMGRRSFLFRLTVLCPVGMGIRFCRGGFVWSVPYRRSHNQPMKFSFVCRAAVMLQGGGLAGAAVAGLMCTVAVKYRFVSVDAWSFSVFSPGRSFCPASVVSLPFSAFLARSSLPDTCFSCLRSTGGCSVLSLSFRFSP